MAQFTYDFTVAGSGKFPIDMLRYDECWPVDAAAASRIQADINTGERTPIQLRTNKRGGPTAARWDSFGWKVVKTEEDYG